jgi:hypothetical protein
MTKKAAQPTKAGKANDSLLLSRKVGGLRVSVFENVREDGSRWYNCPVVRWYKDKKTGSFVKGNFLGTDMDDLELAASLVREVIQKRIASLAEPKLDDQSDTKVA